MDEALCDELLQEVFSRLPPPSSRDVSLVSKRWLHLYRSSKTSLCLRLTADVSTTMSSLLYQYPSLSSLSLSLLFHSPDTSVSDYLLLVVASSPFSSKLTNLRFLAGAVRTSSLLSLSKTCTHLTSLTIFLPRPLSFNWLASCSSLRELSVSISISISADENSIAEEVHDFESNLETVCLSGIRIHDSGIGSLWRSCKTLKKLQLKSCEGLGDGGSYSSFTSALHSLREVELRTCRAIVDGVLLKLAEHCESLTSLLVYDGGSRNGLLQFITSCRSKIERVDLRLPLDFKNDHLFALALNFRNLSSLKLQSCCLVTGDGLRTFAIAMSGHLQELSLINCDVVEREPGLLATLGQHLRQLRKLDLSYNEMLPDKELVSMLVSCGFLVDLRLRGCKGLSGALMGSISRNCSRLEGIDLMHCCGVDSKAVEHLLMNSTRLKHIQVEEDKVSYNVRKQASMRFIEVTNNVV